MESILYLTLLIATLTASSPLQNIPNKRRESLSCPAPSGLDGVCVFIPGVNCLTDSECKGGKLCCNEGCGKICKTPMTVIKPGPSHHTGSCPKPSGTALDICMFQPGVNCVEDSECAPDEKCCEEGCNRICKKSH